MREATVESRTRLGAESKPSRRLAAKDGVQKESKEQKSRSAEAPGRTKRERERQRRKREKSGSGAGLHGSS